jgi:hypothetical protein
LKFNKHEDLILGCEDFGDSAKPDKLKPADQGIVFMVTGLTLRWKQIIGFCLASHNLPFENLNTLIDEAINKLKNVGYTVKAIIMDQEATQWKWVKSVGAADKVKPYFIHEENKVFVMPDPPHLLKNLQNNMINKDVHFQLNGEPMVAKWAHCRELHKLDRVHPVKSVPKWTDMHFDLPRGKKKKYCY